MNHAAVVDGLPFSNLALISNQAFQSTIFVAISFVRSYVEERRSTLSLQTMTR